MFKLKKLSGIISLLVVGALDMPCFAEDVLAAPGDGSVQSIGASRPVAPSTPAAAEKPKVAKPANPVSQPAMPAKQAVAPKPAEIVKPEIASKPVVEAKPIEPIKKSPAVVDAAPKQQPLVDKPSASPSVKVAQEASVTDKKVSKASPSASVREGSADKGAIETLLERARYWQRTGQMSLSVSAWQRVLISEPKQEEALAGLASYYTKSGQRDQAAPYLKRLREVNPLSPTVKLIVEAGIMRDAGRGKADGQQNETVDTKYYTVLDAANQARQQKRLKDSESLYREAMGLAPQMPEAPSALGDVLMEQGKTSEAEAEYRKVLTLYSDYPEALLGLAKIAADRKNFKEALRLVDRHDQLLPGTSVSKLLRSSIYLRMGQQAEAEGKLGDALDLFKRAEAMNPVDAWPIFAQARLHWKAGNLPAAETAVGKLSRLTSSDARFASALYFSEVGLWEDGYNNLNRIPAKDHTDEMKKLRRRLEVHLALENAKTLFDQTKKEAAREKIASIEQTANGDAELVTAVAQAWAYIGRSDLAATLLERNRPLSIGLEVMYSGYLLNTKQGEKLDKEIVDILARPDYVKLNEIQKHDFGRIRVLRAIRRSDEQRGSHRLEDLLKEFDGLQAEYPKDIDLLQTKVKLLQLHGQYDEAERIAQLVVALTEAQELPADIGDINSSEYVGYDLAAILPEGKVESAGSNGQVTQDAVTFTLK